MHLIEEIARHAGHMDITRELLDGHRSVKSGRRIFVRREFNDRCRHRPSAHRDTVEAYVNELHR